MPPMGGKGVGRSGVLARWRALSANMSETFTPEEFNVEGGWETR